MDPDGLIGISGAVCGVLALAVCRFAGAVSASDAERDSRTRLGFSERLAGLGALFCLACGFFAFGVIRTLAAKGHGLWGVLVLVVFACLAVLCTALGVAKGGAGEKSAVLTVLGAVLSAPAQLVFRFLHLSAETDVTEEDLLNMVDDVEEQDLIDESQKEMITGIFELDDVTAGDIMTHRTEIVAVAEDTAAGEAVQRALREGVSRMPVYRKSLDDIVGILYVKDLFALWDAPEKADTPVSCFMRSAMFVPEACRARELLVDFKLKHTQIAVVVDEYGGTGGIVTMEDILEEIVGNIQDEFDNEEEEIVRSGNGVIAMGSADLEDVFEALDLEVPDAEDADEDGEPDFTTVGGLVIDRLGRIPARGEHVEVCWAGVRFTVLETEERRILKVRCELAAPQKENE